MSSEQRQHSQLATTSSSAGRNQTTAQKMAIQEKASNTADKTPTKHHMKEDIGMARREPSFTVQSAKQGEDMEKKMKESIAAGSLDRSTGITPSPCGQAAYRHDSWAGDEPGSRGSWSAAECEALALEAPQNSRAASRPATAGASLAGQGEETGACLGPSFQHVLCEEL